MRVFYRGYQMYRIDDLHLWVGVNNVQQRVAYVLERFSKAFPSVSRGKDELFGRVEEGALRCGTVRGL